MMKTSTTMDNQVVYMDVIFCFECPFCDKLEGKDWCHPNARLVEKDDFCSLPLRYPKERP